MNGLVHEQWLIPAVPLLAAAVQAFLRRGQRRLSAALSIGAMSISCVLALRAFIATASTHDAERAVANFTWFTYGTTELALGWILDPLTAAMALMVTFVGLMIFINATGYMAEDENFTRFFGFLSLFAGAMLGLVVANNLLLLFVCWELVGLCSYLLIGFWYQRPSAAAAMKKAFITTRVGDVGFFIGLLLLYWQTGTLQLYDNGQGALEQAAGLATVPGWWGLSMASTVALLLFLGAMGKSAQFPLHVWLPDAMEGPTPVSALIHAATMVAAGVFMVGRMFPLFTAEAGNWVLDAVLWIGCFTALFTATIALAQYDIKRVLAYSTCSQLGYMMMALGAGGLVAGQFHLLTHAFFKALLFLSAGCVIIGTHHEQDMRRMGGLKQRMPITFCCYLIGMLALAGVPPLAGFFSKDEVLLTTFQRSRLAWALATFTAFLTALYMTRQMVLVFAGRWRGGHHQPREVACNMWMPLVGLAVFVIVLGFWSAGYAHFLGVVEEPQAGKAWVMGLSIAAALTGILLGWGMYRRCAVTDAAFTDPLEIVLGRRVFGWLQRKWYVDEIYEATIVRLTALFGFLSRWCDRRVLDGLLHALAKVTWGASHVTRWVGDELLINGGFDAGCQTLRDSGRGFARLQSGRLQDHLRVLALGVAVLLLMYFLR